MKFTREQYNENIGPWYLDDFPISNDDDFMFNLFNLLPGKLQGQGFGFAAGDTEFRDAVFVYLIKICFQLTPKQFYQNQFNNLEFLSLETIERKIKEYDCAKQIK